ncbi:MAG: pyruvate dehydrogenase complex dihydrolipoamide acetyltransferase, partial [Mariprofundaceae bacterium]|nr:pyruvate dehydrogenase complex dihydrolipoamide acetyltransferase [Mariprofundaceae bacterium]
VETDKATMEMEVVDEGTLYKILQPEGAVVAVGAPIAVIAEEGEEVPDDYMPEDGAEASPEPAPQVEEKALAAPAAAEPAAQPAPETPPPATPSQRIKASPLARRLAKQKGINLAAVQGTGPGGRITKADIEKAVKRGISLGAGTVTAPPPARPLPTGPLPYHEDEYERVENSMMRKAIARRLVESKQTAPHFYLTVDIRMDRLMDLRTQLNEAADGDFRLSVNDFIIKAVAKSLTDVPEANATWTEGATLRHKHAHVSVAVAIEGGLITPVIRHAEQKGIVDISNEVRELAGRAREGALKPEEYTGGTFSISNLGMFGIREFAAVVNPPEGAILAVGATEERAVAENGEIRARQMMTVTLSCDHRVVDGAVGANFLAALKQHLECPAGLLL